MLSNIYWLLPEIFLTSVSVIVLGLGAFLKLMNKKLKNLLVLTLLLTVGILINLLNNERIYICNDLLVSTDSIILVKIVLLITSSIILLLPTRIKYIRSSKGTEGYKNELENIPTYEFGLLIILSILGMMLLVSSNDLIMLYLGIELISLSLYILTGINRKSQDSTEAGLKYFILGALSSGLILFGMGLLYGYTGETNLVNIGGFIWYTPELYQIKVGGLFVIIGLLFKVGAAPFHMWLPDVYEGAPTIVTAYFAIVPKIAILLTLINLLVVPFIGIWYSIQPFLIIAAILSLIVGSLGGINQGKIKRLISYSAISHVGFILIGIIPLSLYSIESSIIYILIYIILSLSTFTILINFSEHRYISQFSGLSRYNPVLAFTFAFILLSIAGIPPLAGFFSKYLVLMNAVDNGFYILAFIAVLTSAISTFYYLRIIKWMFFKDSSFYYYNDLYDIIGPTKNKAVFTESGTKNGNWNTARLNFISSIVLGVTLWIILTLLFCPNLLTSFIFWLISSSLI